MAIEAAPLLVAGVAVFAGACVQGTMGFGLAIVAAPIIALVAPDWLPQVVLLISLPMAVGVLLQDHGGFRWQREKWVLLGRVPGTLIGIWVLAYAGTDTIALITAFSVLAAVMASARGWRIAITPLTASSAGVLSALTSTASSVDGPPLALLYQHETARQVRGAISGIFVLGLLLAIGGVAAAGRLNSESCLLAGILIAPLGVGFAVSFWLRRHVQPERFRRYLLLVCTASALLLMARTLLQ